MPLTRDGELRFVASNDLGALGTKEGPPVSYHWSRPSLLLPLLPWLGVLALLALRPNRTAAAWWVWLPLGCVQLLNTGMGGLPDFVPAEVLDLFRQVIFALSLGVTAVWLTAPVLGSKYRFLAFLKMLLVQAGTCLFVWMLHQSLDEFDAEQLAVLVCIGILSLAVVGALCLAGFKSRQGFRPARFLPWLLLWLLVGVTLPVLPFALIAFVSQGASILLSFGTVVLTGAAGVFALLLPFLVLSLTNHFYRTRLRQLLGMGVATSPPLLVPGGAPATAS